MTAFFLLLLNNPLTLTLQHFLFLFLFFLFYLWIQQHLPKQLLYECIFYLIIFLTVVFWLFILFFIDSFIELAATEPLLLLWCRTLWGFDLHWNCGWKLLGLHVIVINRFKWITRLFNGRQLEDNVVWHFSWFNFLSFLIIILKCSIHQLFIMWSIHIIFDVHLILIFLIG